MKFIRLQRSVCALLITALSFSVVALGPQTVRADENEEENVIIEDQQEATPDDIQIEDVQGDFDESLDEDSDSSDEYFELMDTESDILSFNEDTVSELYSASSYTPYFTEYDQLIYDALKEKIEDVANGNTSSTVLMIPAEDLGIQDIRFYPEDLGMTNEEICDGTYLSHEAYAKTLDILAGNYYCTFLKLKLELPYYFFWVDITQDINLGSRGLYGYYDPERGDYYTSCTEAITFEVCVSEDYCGSDIMDVSAEAVAKAQTARNNAIEIVNRYSTLSDEDKLRAYRDEICNLTDYDFNAQRYGESYQLLNVFDNNPDTCVVCEGYSKAFKFLCDLTEFSSDSVECYLALGDTSFGNNPGGHMWNIVNIDGKNYMVDITNSDFPDATEENIPYMLLPYSGSYDTEYIFRIEGEDRDLTYNYGDGIFLIYTPDRYTLELKDTNQYLYGWNRDYKGWWYINPDGTRSANRWQIINGKWYFFGADGYMKTGWCLYSGQWYYLNADGSMRTGWVQHGNKWYYLKQNGSMATGWQLINNHWYYFKTDGSMATGWLRLGNDWYYLNPQNGAMITGWFTYRNEWYYCGPNGKMFTGWHSINNEWYYFNELGVMLHDTTIDSYRLGSDGAWIN
jgi:glucan-binding YG repeat protein